MKQKARAIPISLTAFSDSSQVVSLFTRETGLLEGIAKGAFRPKSAFQGPFDLCVLYEVVYIERRSPGLAILAEAEVLEGWRGVRSSWERHVLASSVLEFLRAVSVPGERTPELFDLACTTLDRLSSARPEALPWSLLHFEVRALHLLGFLSIVDACVECGRPWPGRHRPAFYDPNAGGLVCRGCRDRSDTKDTVACLPGRAVEVLASLQGSPSAPAGGGREADLLAPLHACVSKSCVAMLERPLRMLRYQAAWLS